MSDGDSPRFWLFSYGTLRQPEVQRTVFGRALHSEPDALRGYGLTMLAITDPAVIAASGSASHPIIRHTGDPADELPGAALAVTAAELAAADSYEVSDYRRVEVILKSGREAFVYVAADVDGAG